MGLPVQHVGSSKSMTPLLVIGGFLALTEVVVGYTLLKVDGGIQTALTVFAIVFPLMVAIGFFLVLWFKPYVFYPPKEYGDDTDVDTFVRAMSQASSGGDPTPPAGDAVPPEVAKAEILPAPAVTGGTVLDEDWFVLWRKKEFDAAVSDLESRASAGKMRPDVAVGIGGAILADRSEEEAVQYWEKGIGALPRGTDHYLFYADHLGDRGKFHSAITVIDRGLAAGARALPLVAAKARFLRQNGRRQEAIDTVKELLAAAPEDLGALKVLAELLDALGEKAPALEVYRQILTLAPDDELALDMVGRAMTDGDDPVGAVRHYLRLTAMFPEKADHWLRLGNAYLNAKLPSKAMEAYEKANELTEGKSSWVLGNIGNLLKNQGLFGRAIKFLQEAVKLTPDDQYLHDRLAASMQLASEEEERLKQLLAPPQPVAQLGPTR